MPKKKPYHVELPITGVVSVFVDEATSAEDAIDQALKKAGLCVLKVRQSDPNDEICVESWEPHRNVNRGNVLHGSLAEAKAEAQE